MNTVLKLKCVEGWWSTSLMIVEPWLWFSFYAQFVYMYGNFVVAKNYCSPTTNQFSHLFIFCTVLYLSRVGCPRGTSHQQPKALWAAVDYKINIAEYPCMAGRRQFLWCWISCIKLWPWLCVCHHICIEWSGDHFWGMSPKHFHFGKKKNS